MKRNNIRFVLQVNALVLPEDCGGPWGYMDLLDVISDPNDPEYDERIEWIGEDFDPELFDIEKINKRLKGTRR